MTEEVIGSEINAGEGVESGSRGKRKFDPGFSRNMLVVVGAAVLAVVVIILVLFFFSGGAKNAQQGSSISIGGSPQQSNDGLTPAMREKLARAQTKEAESAARQGESYIPPDVLPSAPNEPMVTPEAQARAMEAQRQAADNAKQANDERNQMKLAAAQQMLANTLTRPDVERVSVEKVAVAAQAAGGADAKQAPVVAAADEDGDLLVDMMEIFGARLVSPVDTDLSDYASAEITTGKLAGAFLIGKVVLAGEGAQFQFTGMRFKKSTYAINAMALDQATSTSAVRGELDRKLLQRYVFPVAMAYVGALATAKAQVPTVAVPLSGGNVVNTQPSGLAGNVLGGAGAAAAAGASNALLGALGSGTQGVATEYGITRPVPTDAQAKAAGVAAAVNAGNQLTSKLAAEPIRVSMANGTSIGIMFREPVRVSAVVAAKR